MTVTKHFFTFFLGILLTAAIAGCGGNDRPSPASNRTVELTDQVDFLDYDGEVISTVRVAIADTENKRNLGLMNVHELPDDGGMLFLFDDETERSFWMANTPLPLDIIYINRNKEIVKIYHRTSPYSERQLPSGEPAQYVVEVNGGYAREHDIREGMKVDF